MTAFASTRRPFQITGRFVLVSLLAFFLIVGTVNAIMIRFALTTFGGVETDSSYKVGLAFKADAAAAAAQEARGWKVDVRIEPHGQSVVVNVTVRDQAGLVVPNLQPEINLAHPADRRRDVAMVVSEQSPGVFRATAQGSLGRRTLVLELARNGERVFRSVEHIIVP